VQVYAFNLQGMEIISPVARSNLKIISLPFRKQFKRETVSPVEYADRNLIYVWIF
jgi:hypothetical protein